MHPVTIVFKISRRLLKKMSNKEMIAASILTFPNTAPKAASVDEAIRRPFINIANRWLNSRRFTMLCMKNSIT